MFSKRQYEESCYKSSWERKSHFHVKLCHVISVHEEKKIFKYEVYDYTSFLKHTMKRRKCEICKNIFSWKGNMKIDFKLSHWINKCQKRNKIERITIQKLDATKPINKVAKPLNLNRYFQYNFLLANYIFSHTCRSPTFIHPARLSMALSVRRIFDFNQDK